jgi:hypothetical protein
VSVELETPKRAEPRQIAARDPVHREHARRGVVVDGTRDDDSFVVSEIVADDYEVPGFGAVVEFGHQCEPKFLDHVCEPVASSDLGVVIDEVRELVDHLHVFHNPAANVRSLYLHGDRSAVSEYGAVNLAQRRRSGRSRRELRETSRHTHAELGGYDALDVIERYRFDLVLQTPQGTKIDRRQKIRSRRQQLTEFDEVGPHRLEIGRQLFGIFDRRVITIHFIGRATEAITTRGDGVPMFDQQPPKVGITKNMLRLH